MMQSMVKKRQILLFFKEVLFHLIATGENDTKKIKEYTKLPVLAFEKVDRLNEIFKLQIKESKLEKKLIKPDSKDLKTTKIKLIHLRIKFYQLQVS